MLNPFETLRAHCSLPEWLTDKRQLKEYWLLQIGGTHGEEKQAVAAVQQQMSHANHLPGRLPIIAHPQAVAAGVRHIGDRQLMSYYPGHHAGTDVEDRIAASITWLVGQLPRHHVVLDMHNVSPSSIRYASIGERTSPAVLALAQLLGHTEMNIVPWSSFRKTIPRSLINEERPETDPTAANDAVQMASKLGETGLAAWYFDNRERFANMAYFESVSEALLLHPDGTPNEAVLSILPELESLGDAHAGRNAPIPLSQVACNSLGLPFGLSYTAMGPNYRNYSTPIPNKQLGLHDSRQRRLSWGVINTLHPGPQYIDAEGLVYFGSVIPRG